MARKIRLIFVLALVLLACAGGIWWFALRDKPENLHLSAQQWRKDLHVLARELPKRHANVFHYTPRAQFEKAVADLDSQLDRLSADETWVGMQRIVSLVGDAHTYLRTPQDSAPFPIDIGRFGDEYRIISVQSGLENALGTRVEKVNDVPIDRAAAMCRELFSRDENPALGDAFVNDALTTGATLHGLGITPGRNAVRYTVVDDSGREFTVDVHFPGSGGAPVRPFKQLPLYLQDPAQKFSCKYLADAHTLYCNVREMRNLKAPVKWMLATLRDNDAEKLVIDLRHNHGGDYKEGEKDLIDPIRDLAAINKKGHLFVLIGANTFSAAMNNAEQFRDQTAAILVGQEIGERPNSYQEAEEMTLPNSHLTVRYSTKFYRFSSNPENAIRPDQEIVPTWAEYRAGTDPVLMWVLSYSAR